MWPRNQYLRLKLCESMFHTTMCVAGRGRVLVGLGAALLVVALVLTGANPATGQAVPAAPDGAAGLPASSTGAPPPNEINYQGYATDASGRPLNGKLTAVARLFDQATGGSLYWGPETHTNVPVRNGAFQIVLGDQLPFTSGSSYLFGNTLYLELGINGTTLPRQKLRAVPYAMIAQALVSGAWVFSSGDQPVTSLGIQNYSTDSQSIGLIVSSTARGIVANGSVGLTASGTSGTAIKADDFVDAEGYRSEQDSYIYFSGAGILPLPNAATGNMAMTLDEFGTMHIRGTGSLPGGRTVLLPLNLPGVLYGQDVAVKSLRLGYNLLSQAEIRRVRLNVAYGTSTSLHITVLDSTNTIYETYPTFASYAGGDFKDGVFNLNLYSGPLLLVLDLYFPNAQSEAQIGDVQLQLGHEPLSQ